MLTLYAPKLFILIAQKRKSIFKRVLQCFGVTKSDIEVKNPVLVPKKHGMTTANFSVLLQC